ncbi:nitroreductase [Caballeronia choica]|uniref:Nitroreductase n=1 Tax=Caballeronia choica TaxID=326476 RepID=A0A158KLD8_9BURK|nr:hypothetical protein [Caballeronia choica]SAL81956.1 nitroreductase [Caballeronia choica]
MLGELLWAANGINRDADGARTAHSALGGYQFEIYVLLATGSCRYDPVTRRPVLSMPLDLRETTAYQHFLAYAALDLLHVADMDRM